MTKRKTSPARPRRRAAPNWRDTFLAALAHSSNVSHAARQARVDTGTVYKARHSDAEFNRRWQHALAEGYDNLEMDLLHRLRSASSKAARRRPGASTTTRSPSAC